MLSRIAFRKGNVEPGYEDVSKRVILCSRGIPLILDVLCFYLHAKTVDAWNFAMDKM